VLTLKIHIISKKKLGYGGVKLTVIVYHCNYDEPKGVNDNAYKGGGGGG
jgi:hypothetical protein